MNTTPETTAVLKAMKDALQSGCSKTDFGVHVIALQRLCKSLEIERNQMKERIATIADEGFGPFPVQTAEENMTAIEQGIFDQRKRIMDALLVADGVCTDGKCKCSASRIRNILANDQSDRMAGATGGIQK